MTPDLERNADCRRAVLTWLAERSTLPHSISAIRRGVNREGADYTEAEIGAALTFLEGHQPALASHTRDPLGSQRFYQATSAGVLHFERGE